MGTSHSRLEPGQSSIDRATIQTRTTANGSTTYMLDWCVRLPNGRMVRRRTQGTTKGEVRFRAQQTLDNLLVTFGGHTHWKPTSQASDYLKQVSYPAFMDSQLAPGTKARYAHVFRYITGECSSCGQQHQESLSQYNLAGAMAFRTMERCIKEVALLHGREDARHTRTVLSKYFIQELIRDGLLTHNPMLGMSIDTSHAKQSTTPTRSGLSLSEAEYDKVLHHLLGVDPAINAPQPKQGRWTLPQRIQVHRNAIDITLLQMGTGLRITEANLLQWSHVTQADDGTVFLEIVAENVKTKRGRRIAILGDDIATHMMKRATGNDTDYVIGSPSDQSKPWVSRNCHRAVRLLYRELAEQLCIPVLDLARSHVWRTTLNMLYMDRVPVVFRSAWFGHDQQVNARHYTDIADANVMIQASRKRQNQ
jgi:integrase